MLSRNAVLEFRFQEIYPSMSAGSGSAATVEGSRTTQHVFY